MREGDERQRHQQFGELDATVQNRVPMGDEQQSRFSSQGPYPDVADAKTEAVMKPTASEQAYGETRPAAPETWPKVLRDFYWKFPEAARLIAKQPSSCQFVKECEAKGAKFGGYAEDGPQQDSWAYTVQSSVYIPKSTGDPIESMSSFLFELNNAVRQPAFEVLRTDALKGPRSANDAKSYARKTVELEVEGMLKSGEVWLAAKKDAGKEDDPVWSSHDHSFYVQQYQEYKAGTITKDQIVTNVLASTYPRGKNKGMTVQQFYEDQFTTLNTVVPMGDTDLMNPFEK